MIHAVSGERDMRDGRPQGALSSTYLMIVGTLALTSVGIPMTNSASPATTRGRVIGLPMSAKRRLQPRLRALIKSPLLHLVLLLASDLQDLLGCSRLEGVMDHVHESQR